MVRRLEAGGLGRASVFANLGFSYNPMFTGETAACMLVGEHASVMLLSHDTFARSAHLPMAHPATHAPALYCCSVSARDELDGHGRQVMGTFAASMQEADAVV